jgi:putative transposase
MHSNKFDKKLYQEKYRIKSARLPYYDYSSDGWYFVTICTKNMVKYFGEVRDYVMDLSDIGRIAAKFWQEIPKHFSCVRLDEWVVMPNHVHGIIIIDKPFTDQRRDAINRVSTNGGITKNNNPMGKNVLGEIVRWFKGRVSFETHKIYQNFAWQTRFYDHIIQDEKSLNEIRQYIYYNPEKWQLDRNNPENLWI